MLQLDDETLAVALTAEMPVQFFIPLSNDYRVHPRIVANSVTGKGLQFEFEAFSDGKMWALVVKQQGIELEEK